MTKTSLKERCRQILHGTPIHQLITGSDFDFLCTVFAMHPAAKEKLKSGIAKICVIERQGSRCFYFLRNDGVKDDISYKYSIDGYGTELGQITRAARNTISPRNLQI